MQHTHPVGIASGTTMPQEAGPLKAAFKPVNYEKLQEIVPHK